MSTRRTRKHVIDARGSISGYWSEVADSWELLTFMSWQAVRLRYRQTWAGAVWTLLRPVLLTLALTLVFSGFIRLSSISPYTITTLVAVAPWILVSSILTSCCSSITQNQYLISKVYFPRILLPLSMVLLNILDFAVILILLATLMTFKGYLPPTRIIWLPLVLAYTLVAAISAGVWLSALNVRYRDIGIGLPFLIQIGALISPVGFTTHLVPVEWRPLFSLNPMVGIIELFRFALLNEDVPIYWEGVALSVAVVSLLAISGIFYFRESEKVFLDHA